MCARRRVFLFRALAAFIFPPFFTLLAPVDIQGAERTTGLYAWYVQADNVEVPLEHAHEHYPDALFIQWTANWSVVGETLARAIRRVPPIDNFLVLHRAERRSA